MFQEILLPESAAAFPRTRSLLIATGIQAAALSLFLLQPLYRCPMPPVPTSPLNVDFPVMTPPAEVSVTRVHQVVNTPSPVPAPPQMVSTGAPATAVPAPNFNFTTATGTASLPFRGFVNSAPGVFQPGANSNGSNPGRARQHVTGAAAQRISSGVLEAHCLFCPAPEYPALARATNMSGTVVIEALVGSDGHILRCRAASGSPIFVGEALRAVSQWRFSPTLLDGNPVQVTTRITLVFQLPRE